MGPIILQILIDTPLLTFCIVAALGYLLGHVKIGGSSLGTAAVLFAGLLVGAIAPRLKLPDALYLPQGLIAEAFTKQPDRGQCVPHCAMALPSAQSGRTPGRGESQRALSVQEGADSEEV